MANSIDREKVISDIEQQIRWIEEIECHKFPGWLNVTNAMRDAIALLKDQELKPIEYKACADAVLKMWMENVLTDGEYNKIMDKLNKAHKEGRI